MRANLGKIDVFSVINQVECAVSVDFHLIPQRFEKCNVTAALNLWRERKQGRLLLAEQSSLARATERNIAQSGRETLF
jgi:hypothetical protein